MAQNPIFLMTDNTLIRTYETVSAGEVPAPHVTDYTNYRSRALESTGYKRQDETYSEY